MGIRSRTLFTKYARNSGGSATANGNYSVTPDDFFVEVPTNETKLICTRMIVYIEDAGTSKAETYGALTALTNGIEVILSRGVIETDLSDGVHVKSNAQWGRLCYDVDVKNWGNGNEAVVVRWTFSKSGTDLALAPGDKLIIRLSDNLTGLIDHTFLIQGYSENHGL